MRCKAGFIDDDRGSCVARPQGDTVRVTRVVEQVQTELAKAVGDAKTPEERRARLQDLFDKARKETS